MQFLVDNSVNRRSSFAGAFDQKHVLAADERFHEHGAPSTIPQYSATILRIPGPSESSPTGALFRKLTLLAPAGKDWLAVYTLEATGGWKLEISGCYIVPDNGAKVLSEVFSKITEAVVRG